MGNEKKEESNMPPSLFHNIFVGYEHNWQKLPLIIKEQCTWYKTPPENNKNISLMLFDGRHPDCIELLTENKFPVIVLCNRKRGHEVAKFNAAGAINTFCTITEIDDILSAMRIAEHLSRHFNDIANQIENKQARTLLHTAQSIGVSYDVNQLLIQIADSIMDVVSATNVSIARVDIENEHVLDVLTNNAWMTDKPITFTYAELQEGLSGHAIRTKETIVSSGIEPDERESVSVQERRIRVNAGALIIVPIMYDDSVIGTFTISRDRGQADFTQTEVDTVTTMVQMGAVGIQNAQLSQNVHDALNQTQILLNVAEALISSDNPAALLERVLKEIINGLNATGGMYIHYNVDKEQIISSQRFIKHRNTIQTEFVPDYSFFMGGLTGYAIRNKQPVLSTEQSDQRQSEDVYRYRIAQNTGAVIVAPIINSGKVLGTISVHRLIGEVNFTNSELGVLTAVANQVASALIHVRSFEDSKLRVDILAKRLEQRNHDLEVRNEELRRVNKQLQQVDKLKDKFVGEVSHELTKPVAAFRLYLSMLEKRPDRLPQYFPILNDETNRFVALLTAILDLARLHVVDTQIQGEPIDFTDIIRQQVAQYWPQCREKKLLLESNIEPLPTIKGMPDLLSKMVDHLLKNALIYTDRGGIIVSSSYDGSTVWLEVQDSGIGIPEDEIPFIHHRFRRGKRVEQERPGIGLGLSFVDGIVKLHGGTLDITSELDRGSTFRVTLPIHMASHQQFQI